MAMIFMTLYTGGVYKSPGFETAVPVAFAGLVEMLASFRKGNNYRRVPLLFGGFASTHVSLTLLS